MRQVKKIRPIARLILLVSAVVLMTVLHNSSATVAQDSYDITRIAAVTSAPTPLPGQKNRSSGNFSVRTIPPYANALLWRVFQDGTPNPNIIFDVKVDRTTRKDPYLSTRLRHGSITGISFDRKHSLYIANPGGARGNFQVEVNGIAR